MLALRIQNKLMQLSELYGVSIDYLMKGDKALDNFSQEEKHSEVLKVEIAKPCEDKETLIQRNILFLSMILSSVLFICILIFACRLFASHSFNIEGKVQDTILINRIYHQYTNAEIVRVNDQGSFVKETVWLDIPGVREDDYVFCYQDAGEPGRVMFSDDQGTLVIPFIFCIIFLIFFIVFWMMWRNIRGEKNGEK